MTITRALRFNTDSMKLEIFRGSKHEGSASMAGIGTLAAGQWEEIQRITRGSDWWNSWYMGWTSTRPANTNRIDYQNIDSTGNAIDFGDLSDDRRSIASSFKNS